MADSSPLTLLAPKRQRLGTNWEKCIVCQSNSNERLKEATENTLATFVKAVSDRRDDRQPSIHTFEAYFHFKWQN